MTLVFIWREVIELKSVSAYWYARQNMFDLHATIMIYIFIHRDRDAKGGYTV